MMVARTECSGWVIEGDRLMAPDGRSYTVDTLDDGTFAWLGMELQVHRLTATFVRRFNVWGSGRVGLFAPHLELTNPG